MSAITYRAATMSDLDSLVDFCALHATPLTPPCAALNIDPEPLRPFYREILTICLNENLTFIALNKQGEIVGMRASHTHKPHMEFTTLEFMKDLHEDHPIVLFLRYIVVIMSGMTDLIPRTHTKIVKFFWVCTRADYQRRGIASELLHLSIDRARELGYDGIAVKLLAHSSQRLFQDKFGFDVLKTLYHKYFLDSNGKQAIVCKDETVKGQLCYLSLK